jgi:hypothetical protein
MVFNFGVTMVTNPFFFWFAVRGGVQTINGTALSQSDFGIFARLHMDQKAWAKSALWSMCAVVQYAGQAWVELQLLW